MAFAQAWCTTAKVILIGLNPGRLPAAVGIIDDENGDIGLVAITQVVNFIHVAIGLVGKAPQMNELITDSI